MYPLVYLTCFAVASLLCTRAEQICFPKEFSFGVSTAAYQIEGAWNVADKGESIWDHYTHEHPERVVDGSNGDVACDSYHRRADDERILAELGVQHYRLSVAWSRLLPDGFSNKVSADGLRYYNEVIDGLVGRNITPVVTMHHYDLPQPLQQLGGWTSAAVADYFLDYAKVLYRSFGDRVKTWITFNEPYTFCRSGYGGLDAPGGGSSGVQTYMCGHNVLRAHAMAYRAYREGFLEEQKGRVGITLDISWVEPETNRQEDLDAAERARQFIFGWFAHPLLSASGDYPPVMRQNIDRNSKKQGYPRSRLPTFTKAEIENLKGATDFIGLNSYTANLARDTQENYTDISFGADMNVVMHQDPSWPSTNSTWLKVTPWAFRKVLNWIRTSYANPPLLVTENGVSTRRGLRDAARVQYIDGYLRALHRAVVGDGCNVSGYTHWSLMDNFEWLRGFSERFGLYEVDYSSPRRTRTPRLSAAYYRRVCLTRCLPSAADLASMLRASDVSGADYVIRGV